MVWSNAKFATKPWQPGVPRARRSREAAGCLMGVADKYIGLKEGERCFCWRSGRIVGGAGESLVQGWRYRSKARGCTLAQTQTCTKGNSPQASNCIFIYQASTSTDRQRTRKIEGISVRPLLLWTISQCKPCLHKSSHVRQVPLLIICASFIPISNTIRFPSRFLGFQRPAYAPFNKRSKKSVTGREGFGLRCLRFTVRCRQSDSNECVDERAATFLERRRRPSSGESGMGREGTWSSVEKWRRSGKPWGDVEKWKVVTFQGTLEIP